MGKKFRSLKNGTILTTEGDLTRVCEESSVWEEVVEEEFRCPDCDYTAKSKAALTRHRNKEHAE